MQNVYSVEEMRRFDRQTVESGVSSEKLMYNAGVAIRNVYSFPGKTAIICGKGNNAGDGYVLALLLAQENKSCDLFLIEETFSKDGKKYFDDCLAVGVPAYDINVRSDLKGYDTVVDCIFGTGFKGEPQKKYKNAIEKINGSEAFVLSVDINSGLNGDNGLGTTIVKSDLTVTIGGYKSGLFLNKAKDYIKQIVSVDIGIKTENTRLFVAEDTDLCDFLQPRKNFSHKGDYGYVGIMGGCEKYPGALKLAASSLAALKSGCGVSTIITDSETAKYVAGCVVESTIFPLADEKEKALTGLLPKTKALSVGMGWGVDAEKEGLLSFVLRNYEGRLILDADALNVLSKHRIWLKEKRGTVVVTPHVGEMSRLTGLTATEITEDPVSVARDFSAENGVITVLKGTATVVSDGERTVICPRGAAGMATAGSGDVLSGILTGVLGQGKDVFASTVYGVYLNGLAGEIAQEEVGDICMTSTDTVRSIPFAVRALRVSCGLS